MSFFSLILSSFLLNVSFGQNGCQTMKLICSPNLPPNQVNLQCDRLQNKFNNCNNLEIVPTPGTGPQWKVECENAVTAAPTNVPTSNPVEASSLIWINEFHYDNSGTDSGEFIELAGTENLDLTGYTLYLINGNGGVIYDTISLSGTLNGNPECGIGFKVIDFDTNGIQNGSPDGIALVDDSDNLIEFISYEGQITLGDVGITALNSQTSNDIGVSESSSTLAGYSLQRTGMEAVDTNTFASAAAETREAINTGVGQAFC